MHFYESSVPICAKYSIIQLVLLKFERRTALMFEVIKVQAITVQLVATAYYSFKIEFSTLYRLTDTVQGYYSVDRLRPTVVQQQSVLRSQ